MRSFFLPHLPGQDTCRREPIEDAGHAPGAGRTLRGRLRDGSPTVLPCMLLQGIGVLKTGSGIRCRCPGVHACRVPGRPPTGTTTSPGLSSKEYPRDGARTRSALAGLGNAAPTRLTHVPAGDRCPPVRSCSPVQDPQDLLDPLRRDRSPVKQPADDCISLSPGAVLEGRVPAVAEEYDRLIPEVLQYP